MSFFMFLYNVLLWNLLASTILCQASEEGTAPLTIDPFRLSTEVGKEAIFSCILTNPSSSAKFSWYYPDNVTRIEQISNTTRVFVDDMSRLHVKDCRENDTGTYLCSATIDPSNDTISSDTSLPPFSTQQTFSDTEFPLNVTKAASMSNTDASSHSTITVIDKLGFTEKNTVNPEVYNATVYLKVYIMPTYFTEGMIILAVNLALLLVFLICLAQSLVTEKKRMKLYYKN